MKYKIKCELFVQFNQTELPIEELKGLMYHWVFQNISDLDHTGQLVDTWSTSVELQSSYEEGDLCQSKKK